MIQTKKELGVPLIGDQRPSAFNPPLPAMRRFPTNGEFSARIQTANALSHTKAGEPWICCASERSPSSVHLTLVLLFTTVTFMSNYRPITDLRGRAILSTSRSNVVKASVDGSEVCHNIAVSRRRLESWSHS